MSSDKNVHISALFQVVGVTFQTKSKGLTACFSPCSFSPSSISEATLTKEHSDYAANSILTDSYFLRKNAKLGWQYA